MIGTIDLYSLALTPNDTMYFDSVNAQTQWFNERQHLSIDDVSFNGSRAFKLGSNYLDIIFQYNYVRYQLNGRYIYAFIENVDYSNDNCCSLQVSIDLNQTFLQELQTAIVTSNIGNTTEKNSYFNTYKPYDNKVSVADYNTIHLGKLNTVLWQNRYILGYVLMNVDPNLELLIATNKSSRKIGFVLRDLDYYTPCSCIAMPLWYDIENRKFVSGLLTVPYKIDNGNIEYGIASGNLLNSFIKAYGSYLANSAIGITFENIGGIEVEYDNGDPYIHFSSDTATVIKDISVERTPTGQYDVELGGDLLVIKRNINKTVNTYNLETYLSNIPTPLLRSPYLYLRIGNDSEYITLNLLDFYYNENITRPLTLTIEKFTSCVYPFTNNLKFKLNNIDIADRNAMFNIITTEPIPYRIDAWQSYYAQNKASVNDGLATKQKYERQEQIISTVSNMAIGAIDVAQTLIPYTKAGNYYKYKGAKGNKVSDRTVNNAIGSGAGMIIGAIADWSNSELEREKERKLLEINWNDIKSSPAEFSNMSSSITAKYNTGPQCIEIDLYIAKNINDIIKYHKQYGYKVNRMEHISWGSIRKHNLFDFISFNTITIKSTLPQFYTAILEQQYETGVRFWYNYDYFMDFERENGEIA